MGASIVASLVGRGKIVSHDSQLKSSVDYVKEDRDGQWIALEQEEKMRRAKLAEEKKAEDESGDEDNDEDEDDAKKGDEKDKKKKND